MKIIRKRGDTSNILQVFIQDSSSTTGAGLTGLVFNTASLTAYYHRDLDTTATAITLVTMTVGTFTSSGFKEIDATNMPGWYQFCPPDAAFGSGTAAHSVAFHLKGATNMAPLPIECQLVAVDVEDTVRAGLTALPNVASGSAGAIPTTGTGANQLSVSSGQVILQTGTGTGQLDFTSGVVKSNPVQWLGGTIPAVNVTGVPIVDLKYTLGTISPATAGSVRADAVTGAVGSVTGAVGSVTGAVGSVTGNVGGNVTGTVASVVGNVGGSVASVTAVSTGAITNGSFAAGAIDAAAIAASAIAASEFDQTAADKIWSTAARTLTANNVSVKKNSALSGFQFFMVDSADHFTPKTGLTITAVRSINGAAFGACTNAATEIANGWYTIDLSAADLNGNTIALKLTATGADQANILLVTNV